MRRLPVLVERTVSSVKALQSQTGEAFEAKLRRTSTNLPRCKSGCANCCYHPFLITVAEGLLLYRALVAGGTWLKVRKRFIETKDLTLGLDFEIWLKSNIPCPALRSDLTCGAYDARPLHCRVTFSVGDPDLCHPHLLGVNTPLIDNADTVVQFSREVRALLKKVSAQGTLMPLAEAVLLGELVDTGKIPMDESDIQFAKDLFNET